MQIRRFPPDHPAHARKHQPVFMARRIDRLHSRKAEIPPHLGLQKRRDERPAGAIHVDRNIEAGLFLPPVQRGAEGLDVLVVAGDKCCPAPQPRR